VTTVSVTLRSTEVLDGVKRRPGDVVDLTDDHPIVQKIRAAEAAEALALRQAQGEGAGTDPAAPRAKARQARG